MGAQSVMQECCCALEKEGVKYCLGWGTALGIYREGRYIPHDTDIDIEVIDCSDPEKISGIMSSIGMTLGRCVTYKKSIFGERVVQQLAYYSENQVIFDMLFWNTKEGELIYNYSERDYRIKMKGSFLKNTRYVKFCGKEYPIPGDIEGYLEWLYGQDWRIPESDKGDWKKDCHVLEKIGLV